VRLESAIRQDHRLAIGVAADEDDAGLGHRPPETSVSVAREISIERIRSPMAGVPAEFLAGYVLGGHGPAFLGKASCGPDHRKDNGDANSRLYRNQFLPRVRQNAWSNFD